MKTFELTKIKSCDNLIKQTPTKNDYNLVINEDTLFTKNGINVGLYIKIDNNQLQGIREKGESGNPNGRPKGSKNRSTIAKYWLEVNQNLKNPLTSEEETMSQEDLMTLALIKKARDGDVNAYKALMDSGYGAPVQQIEQTNIEQPLFPDVNTDDCN
jgi:hypothetical protein